MINKCIILLTLFIGLLLTSQNIVYAANSPNLGQSASFSVLGFSNVTNTNLTTLSADLGVWSGSSITGFFGTLLNDGPGIFSGSIHQTDAVAQQAQADALAADSDILSQAKTADLGPLDSLVLVPGVYDLAAGSLSGGVLTLDGPGVYIFRTTSTLVSAGSINLINGARACDVFWHVESAATINGSSFVGTIIAKTGIHFGTGVSLNGRALAIGADVTMDGNAISGPTCASTSSNTATNTNNNSPSSVSYCPPISNQVVTPIIIESKRVDADSLYIKWGPYSGVDTFNVQYGFESGKLLYTTNVTGFSTTINDLDPNQPIWVRVAARNDCQIGTYGEAKLVGSPKLPNTGFSPQKNTLFNFINLIKNWFL